MGMCAYGLGRVARSDHKRSWTPGASHLEVTCNAAVS